MTALAGEGYISNDGHSFTCTNPASLRQTYHVCVIYIFLRQFPLIKCANSIFVIDRSSSMGRHDRGPLPDTPVTALINRHAANRLGAVYSSLYAFWTSRHTAVNPARRQGSIGRRDAYSVLFFHNRVVEGATHDFSSTPDELLRALLAHGTHGGTDFTIALQHAQRTMQRHWSDERYGSSCLCS